MYREKSLHLGYSVGYSTRIMTVYMDVFNGMFKLWIERTKDEYEKCLEEWSGLLHANDSSLQTKAWDYIHLASKRAKTMDSHDQQAFESMEQLIDYLNTLLAWYLDLCQIIK